MAEKWSERLLRTRAQVQTLIAGSGLNYPGFFQISDAVGATKQILVWSTANNAISGIGIDLTNNEIGIYDIGADTFTATPKYKIYAVAISQSGTGDPTVVVLQNDFVGVTFAWTRDGIGTYTLTASSDVFKASKTPAVGGCPQNGGIYTLGNINFGIDTNTMALTTYYPDLLTGSDDVLLNDLIEIKVWN